MPSAGWYLMAPVATLEQIFGLRGHRAVVTGASSGLGVEFAETLAMAGADVALVARRADWLEEVAKRLAEYAVRTAVVPGDLRAALLFPVSPASSYVTGSTVFVDGGYTAW